MMRISTHGLVWKNNLLRKQLGIERLMAHCADDSEQGMYIQRPHEVLEKTGSLLLSKSILFILLDAMEVRYQILNEEQSVDNVQKT